MSNAHRLLLCAPALFVVVLSQAVPAQTGSTPSLTGKWAGSLDVIHLDGSVEPGDAFMSLTQNGSEMSGSAGAGPTQQDPIATGHVSGVTVEFAVKLKNGSQVQFNLSRDGDHLRGTATGLPVEEGSKIDVDVVRADPQWHTPTPVAHVPDRLLEVITALDKKLFDAYNTCDLTTMGSLVSDDLEFYHDKTGLAVGKPVFLDAIRNNICGKVERVIVPGTLEVHRLKGFGAMEMVTHRFEHPGDPQNGEGEAKSIMLWRLKDGAWTMTRVISYDHGAAKK